MNKELTKTQYKKTKLALKLMKSIKCKDKNKEKERQEMIKKAEEIIKRYENGER